MRSLVLQALCISRKVKKSESKSQRISWVVAQVIRCVYPVKLKNLKANHNKQDCVLRCYGVVYIP